MSSPEELRATVEGLLGVVEELADRVEELERRTRVEEADLDPETLPAWVEWLRDTYRLHDKIRDDWATVPGVVDELAALRAAWHSAYDDQGRPLRRFDAVQWHDALARTLGRIKDTWYAAHRGRDGARGTAVTAPLDSTPHEGARS